MNYHLDGHGLHGTLLASAAQKACRRHEWKLMLYCMGLFVRAGKVRYVLKKLCLYMVEDSNVFAAPRERADFLQRLKNFKRQQPWEGQSATTALFELIYLVCMTPKSRLADHSICVAAEWAVELTRKTPALNFLTIKNRLQEHVRQGEWKPALAYVYMCKELYYPSLHSLWNVMPEQQYYSDLILGDPTLWNQELLLCESILHLHPTFVRRDWPVVSEHPREAAWDFWQKLMVAPLNYELRGWIDWQPWEELVWDKHTNRGNGQDTLATLLLKYPDVPKAWHAPDGPPMKHARSKMEAFFDHGSWLPRETLVDPFWQGARDFFVRVESLGFKHGEYFRKHLEAKKRKVTDYNTVWDKFRKKKQ